MKRKWNKTDLENAIITSKSYRQVLLKIGLKQAGGNYSQIKKYIEENSYDIKHFQGKAWNKGLKYVGTSRVPLEQVLVKGSNFQSYKLKKRLFNAGIKKQQCEICGWAEKSVDGRIPLELNHIDGDPKDNRLENLQILCPNCHSLTTNYRGKNKKSY